LAGRVGPSTKLIIIADDDPAQCAELALLVQMMGYRTLCFSDGEEALGAMIEHQAEAILLDINLPVRDGIRVAELAMHINHRVRICLLSGSPERCEEARVRQLGHVLVKPITRDMLRHALF
jgi:CheY-like chemotaxis protein